MQKFLTLLGSVTIFGLMTIGFSSCKDDEKEPVIVNLSFSSATKTVAEGEQGVKANLVLDQPAPADLIITYEITGSATRKIGSLAGDYEIVGSAGEVEIAAGQTSGSIDLNIIADNLFEEEEKIIFTISDANSSQIEIGTEDQMEITIEGGGALTASFAATTLTLKESDEGTEGIHEFMVELSSASTADVVVQYELKAWLDANDDFVPGTAIDSLSASAEGLPSDYYDYYIDGVSGELTIPAGQTSAAIRVNVLSDFIFENDETLEITLKESTGITVGTNSKMTVTIEQEDGTIVNLLWPAEAQADMDMFLWVKFEDEFFPFALAINPSNTGPERRIIPDVFSEGLLAELGVTSLQYGGSYIYYSGTTDPLNFDVEIVDYTDGDATLIETNPGAYTLANINPWDDETLGTDPIIEQTFTYSAGTVSEISDITIPAENSRPRTGKSIKGHKSDFARIHF